MSWYLHIYLHNPLHGEMDWGFRFRFYWHQKAGALSRLEVRRSPFHGCWFRVVSMVVSQRTPVSRSRHAAPADLWEGFSQMSETFGGRAAQPVPVETYQIESHSRSRS